MGNKGENLCYFRKKEQCIAVGKALRKKKIENYKIYRIAKDGTVTFLHPSDVKWTKYHMKSFEADPLTTMFVKARVKAFADVENLFALPNPTGWVDVTEEDRKKAGM